MEKIESVQNPHIKQWLKLKTKKGRQQQQAYLLDGWHLVKEALRAQIDLQIILVTAEFKYQAEFEELKSTPIKTIEVSAAIAKRLSENPAPQGIFAIAAISRKPLNIPAQISGGWLLLDSVQDPGNIGTMVRTADAAGFAGVVFGEKTADLFQPKVVRAMQGSQFHIKLFKGRLVDWITRFKQQQIPVFGTQVSPQAVSYRQIKAQANLALIMGNEGNGMTDQLLEMTDRNLYIPILGQAESLNVAVAAGILMFYLHRVD
ncbi:MAG: RNA methyltransferase [Liquorilactobacillus nagelii]|uniref:TrmH family RNA methyltransferase n=1 Tax=Liquorilactobacillus nagelii TaxID=82688 RepID=UPI0039E8A8A7